MVTLSFRGFAQGASVALLATQNGNSSSGSVSMWGQGSVGTLNIQTIAPSILVAPIVLGFEAIDIAGFDVSGGPGPGAVYDPSFHEITFIWTINGQPLAPYSAPQNMVTGWNNPNVAYGKKIAFHFSDPGTYVIDLWAVDSSGTTGTASTTIVVSNPDSVFPGVQTVCYSNDPGETWAGEKPSCQRATSFSQLASAIGNASGPLRILFKRGQEYLRTEVQRLQFTGAGDYMNHVGTWGAGAKPILHGLDSGPIFETYNADHTTEWCTFDNLQFRGDWDPVSETGKQTYSPFQFWSNDRSTHFTVSRCDFSGFDLIHGTPGEVSSFMGFADCVVTDWQNMGIFYQTGAAAFVAMLGCRIQQHVDAGNGPPNGEGTNSFYNQHGPMRYGHLDHMYVACCDMFSRCGWFDKTDQPCMRMNTDGAIDKSFIIERVVCEGGSDQITISGNNGGTPEQPGNMLIDRVLLIGTAMNFRSFIYAEYGGLTVRNVIGVMPDVPGYKPNTWNGSIYMTGQIGPDGNEDAPVRVYGNTFLNLQSPANDPGHVWTEFADSEGFTDKTVENNISHGPNLNNSVTAGAAMDLSTDIPGVSPRYKGILFNEFGQENGTLGASVPNNGSFTLPYPAGTGQAYWLALPATDNRHQIQLSGVGFFHASRGQIAVGYETSGIRITNLSGATWNSGVTWALKLDRKSQKSSIPTTYQSPPALPLPRPLSAIGGGLGVMPFDDFEEAERVTPTAGALNL